MWQVPAVFVVQNNQFAISVPLAKQTRARAISDRAIGYGIQGHYVDGNDVAAVYAVVSASLDKARRGKGPTIIECLTYRIEAHTNSDDPSRYRDSREVAKWKGRDPIERLEKYLVSEQILCDEDREAIAAEAEELAAATREAMNTEAVVDPMELFQNVYAATRPEPARAAGPAGRGDGRSRNGCPMSASGPAASAPTSAPSITMAGALNAALRDALSANPDVVVFGEDVGPLGGVFRITDKLHAEFGEDRVWDSPLAEAGIVGTAIGMAMYGMRPVVEMQFDAFSFPAFEQIVSHVAKMRNRTRGRVALPIVIRIPCAGGIGGVEHHSDSSEAYWTHTPGSPWSPRRTRRTRTRCCARRSTATTR